MRLLVLTLLEPYAGQPAGSQALITMFDDGSSTIAFRPHEHATWSAPAAVAVVEPVDGPLG